MKQEDKELLLKDLCGRLPYGVILRLSLLEETTNCRLTGIDEDGYLTADVPADYAFNVEDVKPYLRPMSSMTEEEEEEYRNIDNLSYSCPIDYAHFPASRRIDWLNAYHFDYRGLIEKGLALEAPKGMYN